MSAQKPSTRRVSRDTILFTFGLAGIVYQQYTERVIWQLLIVYGVMVGLPGVQALLALLPPKDDRPAAEGTPTTGSPSDSRSLS